MALNKDCILYEGKNKDCPVSQNGKTFRMLNNSGSEIKIYEVDPCLIPPANQRKCDNLFLVNREKSESLAYFVELKGTGISDAIQQIDNSINMLQTDISGYVVFGRIIGRRVTPDIKSRRAKLDEKLKRLGGNLIIASTFEYKETV